MATARFAYTIVYVPDVARATEFYVAAFGCQVRFATDEGDYAELDTGDVTLAFASESLGEANLPGGYQRHSPESLPFACEIAFTSDNLTEVWDQAIEAGATVVVRPAVKPWGQTVAYLRDPDGILIELASPMGG